MVIDIGEGWIVEFEYIDFDVVGVDIIVEE